MKQLKSTLRSIHRAIHAALAPWHLAEPLVSFDEEREASAIHEYLKNRDFDVAGIRRGGLVVGYVRRQDLVAGALREHVKEFEAADVVDETSPPLAVLERLVERPHVLVSIVDEVAGIITKGDLRKAPVQMWLFSLITLVEMHMLRLIRLKYPGGEWQALLKPQRLECARRRLDERCRKNEAIDLADCLQFADKRSVLEQSPELLAILQISRASCKREFERLGRLRNDIAHAQDSLANGWAPVLCLAKFSEDVISRCEAVEES